MRTPNTKCIICEKPLYRRPFEIKKARYFACLEHREEAKSLYGQTEAQIKALELGRQKGDNHLTGLPKSKESNLKRSISAKKTYASHPEIARKRGKKTRGENHCNWKGGVSRLNVSIRQMHENRKWMDSVKERDGECIICGSAENLESHHVVSLLQMIKKYDIKSRKDARNCEALWDIRNGVTLCQRCHYRLHGRKYNENK